MTTLNWITRLTELGYSEAQAYRIVISWIKGSLI